MKPSLSLIPNQAWERSTCFVPGVAGAMGGDAAALLESDADGATERDDAPRVAATRCHVKASRELLLLIWLREGEGKRERT